MIRGWNGSIDDIAETELAILPVGSIENHGPHLPVITDWAIADALGKGVAERTGGFYMPALPISCNKEHRGKRGSVGMHSDVFYRMLVDICLDLKAQGFRQIAVIQGHGGIFVMNSVIRELNADHNPGLMVAKLDVMEVCWPAFESGGLLESPMGLHAEEIETSLMLHLHPELVDISKALDFYLQLDKLTPDNTSILINIGHCYLELKNFPEALNYYYKADYLDPKSQKARRAIAWCSFLTGKYGQAQKYYAQIIENQPQTHDFLNAGHTEWTLRNFKKALEYYTQAIQAESGDFNKFAGLFMQDIRDLEHAGVTSSEIPLLLDWLRYNASI
jgi:creatinine amidohydrolase/Fe(II)-dependent formamide hydrolase-like protein